MREWQLFLLGLMLGMTISLTVELLDAIDRLEAENEALRGPSGLKVVADGK